MPSHEAHPSCRYLGGDAVVTTARGALPVRQVGVGDLVLGGDGGWAQVTHTRRVLHRGALVQIDLAGGGRLRATRAMPVAIGPGLCTDAERLLVGQTVLVPIMQVPDAPDVGRDGQVPHLAWMATQETGDGQRTHLKTPWGNFLAEPSGRPPSNPKEWAPTLTGRYRITPAGLVRLAPAPGRARTTMCEALGRHRHTVWQATFPPPPTHFHRLSGPPAPTGLLICEQSVACRRDGDRIEFGASFGGRALPAMIRALPRRVCGFGVASHAGWVFALSLAGVATLVVDGTVASHYPQGPPEVTEADSEGG